MSQSNEFSQLIDLAIKHNISHSTLIANISSRILDRYQTLYPDKPQQVEVVVNEQNGNISLLHKQQDITPKNFKTLAQKIARETIVNHLHQQETNDLTPQPNRGRDSNTATDQDQDRIKSAISQFLFWAYNSLYIIMCTIFSINFVDNNVFRKEIWNSFTDLNLFRRTILTLIIITPLSSLTWTLWRKFQLKKKINAGELLFTFEIPIILIGLLFFNVFRQPSSFVIFTIASILTAIVSYYFTKNTEMADHSLIEDIAYFCKQNLLLILGYFNLLYLFVLPLLIAEFFPNISLDLFYNPGELVSVFLLGGLAFLFFGLIISLPLLAFYLSLKNYLASRKRVLASQGSAYLRKLTIISITVTTLLSLLVSYQPNHSHYIEQLTDLKETTSFAQRRQAAQELMPQEKKLKRIFDDIKNYRQKYLLDRADDSLRIAYEDELGLSRDIAILLQETFKVTAYPLVYQGDISQARQAQTNFKYLFGEEDDTKDYLSKFQDVLVDKRTIDVKTDYQQYLATITITETYSTKSYQDEEVEYEFFIDGPAVMHDLKLGPNLEFVGRVAPSGAAKTTYEREVSRSRDPALLEQIGPKQYRLRVFPIPDKNDNTTLNGKRQKVQFAYSAPLTKEGFPLPQYTLKNNVKEVTDFILRIDGENVAADQDQAFISNQDIKDKMDQLCQTDLQLQARTNLGIGTGFLVAHKCQEQVKLLAATRDKKIALVHAVSYRNQDNQAISEAYQFLQENHSFIINNQVDWLQYNDLLSVPVTLTRDNYQQELLQKPIYFGRSNLDNTLDSLSTDYDLVFVLTGDSKQTSRLNKSNYRLSESLFIVHTNQIPTYNSALTAALWQSGGNVFTSWQQAAQAAAIKVALKPQTQESTADRKILATDNLYSYELDESNANYATALEKVMADNPSANQDINIPLKTNQKDPLSFLLAQAYLQNQYQQHQKEAANDKDFLDTINKLSQKTQILSPYSSYIALVNQRQINDLERYSEDESRYQDQDKTSFSNRGRQIPIGFMETTRPFSSDMVMAPKNSGGGSMGPASVDGFQARPTLINLLVGSSYLTLFIAANAIILAIAGLVVLVKKGKKIIKNRVDSKK